MDNFELSSISSPTETRINNENSEADILEIEAFSFDGYQVVRSEFFAHITEPSISFNNCRVMVNTACLRKLPDVCYIQFLVNPDTKKMIVRACTDDDKDSFLWCTPKRKPRQITCKIFFAKIVNLMNWNPDYRYKMLGKVIKTGTEYLVFFDLNAAETYQKIYKEGEKPKTLRSPIFPAEWKNQFGVPFEEHKKMLQVNIFDGYTVFSVEDNNFIANQHQDKITTAQEEII